MKFEAIFETLCGCKSTKSIEILDLDLYGRYIYKLPLVNLKTDCFETKTRDFVLVSHWSTKIGYTKLYFMEIYDI